MRRRTKNITFSTNLYTLDSFDRILQYVYTNPHTYTNQSKKKIMSYPEHFDDAVFLAGLWQKPSKFLVLTQTNLCIFKIIFNSSQINNNNYYTLLN